MVVKSSQYYGVAIAVQERGVADQERISRKYAGTPRGDQALKSKLAAEAELQRLRQEAAQNGVAYRVPQNYNSGGVQRGQFYSTTQAQGAALASSPGFKEYSQKTQEQEQTATASNALFARATGATYKPQNAIASALVGGGAGYLVQDPIRSSPGFAEFSQKAQAPPASNPIVAKATEGAYQNYTPAGARDLATARGPRYQYSSAVGFSTEQGTTEILSPTPETARQRLINAKFAVADTGRAAAAGLRKPPSLGEYAPAPFGIAYSLREGGTGSNLISYGGAQVRLAGARLESANQPGSKNFFAGTNAVIGRGVQDIGISYQERPAQTIAGDLATYAVGAGVGELVGLGVKASVAQKGIKVGLGFERAAGYSGIAIGGIAAFTTYQAGGGEALVASAPRFALAGAGYASGYRGVITEPASVSFRGKIRSTTIRQEVRGNTFEGEYLLQQRGSIKFAGNREPLTRASSVSVRGGRIADSDIFVGAAKVSTTTRFGRGFTGEGTTRTGVQTVTLNPQEGIAVFGRPGEAQFGVGSTGRPQKVEGVVSAGKTYAFPQRSYLFSDGRVTDVQKGASVGDQFRLQGGRLGLKRDIIATPQGELTGRYSYYFTRTATEDSSIVFGEGSTRRTRSILSRGDRGRVARGTNLYYEARGGRGNQAFEEAFRSSFRTARQTGIGRKGQIGGNILERYPETTNARFRSSGRPLTVAPVQQFSPAFINRPFFGIGKSQQQQTTISIATTQRSGVDAAFGPRNVFVQAQVPASIQDIFQGQRSSSIQRLGTSQITRSTQINSGGIPNPIPGPMTPEPVGGGGFAFPPLFAPPGGSKREKKGRGRSFKYAPSITAELFNIHGSAPKGQLTGFELRPLTR